LAADLFVKLRVPIGVPHPIESLTLIPAGKGTFDVRLDGQVIFSKKTEGRYPTSDEIVVALLERSGNV